MDKLSKVYKNLAASLAADMADNKFDVFLSKDQFNETAAPLLRTAEIHQLFEDDKIDLVHLDNCYSEYEIVEIDGKRVLVGHVNDSYSNWRKFYDTL